MQNLSLYFEKQKIDFTEDLMRRLKKKRGKKIRNVPALIPCQIEESCKTSMDEGLIKEEEEEAWKMCEQFLFSCVTENVSSCGYITTKNRS